MVANPEDPMEFIEEFGLLTFSSGRHSIFLQRRCAVGLIIGIGQKGPKIQ